MQEGQQSLRFNINYIKRKLYIYTHDDAGPSSTLTNRIHLRHLYTHPSCPFSQCTVFPYTYTQLSFQYPFLFILDKDKTNSYIRELSKQCLEGRKQISDPYIKWDKRIFTTIFFTNFFFLIAFH